MKYGAGSVFARPALARASSFCIVARSVSGLDAAGPAALAARATVRTAGNKILCSERRRFVITVSGWLLRREFALMQPFEYEVLDGVEQILGCCEKFLIATTYDQNCS